MDKSKIYQMFFEQMNEALEWMMTEERPCVVAAYIEGAVCAVSRMLNADPPVGCFTINFTNGGERTIDCAKEVPE